jgi:hypothetical protein
MARDDVEATARWWPGLLSVLLCYALASGIDCRRIAKDKRMVMADGKVVCAVLRPCPKEDGHAK